MNTGNSVLFLEVNTKRLEISFYEGQNWKVASEILI